MDFRTASVFILWLSRHEHHPRTRWTNEHRFCCCIHVRCAALLLSIGAAVINRINRVLRITDDAAHENLPLLALRCLSSIGVVMMWPMS